MDARARRLPPFAHSLRAAVALARSEAPTAPPCVFVYVAGTDADIAWRLAQWRAREKLPVLLIPSGTDPMCYRWPPLHGVDALIIFMPAADADCAPRLALMLFDAGAGEVHAVDTDGKTAHAVYRREALRAAS